MLWKQYFKEHWLAVFVAICFGLLMIYPQLFFIFTTGKEYRGIYIMEADAEKHYVAKMQEAIEGHGWVSPFIFEQKYTLPSAVPTLAETFLVMPGKILGISAVNINLFYKFFLPLIIFLLVYHLFFRLTENKLWSLVAGVFVLSGSVFLKFNELLEVLHWKTGLTEFALFSRPVNPGLSSILFFVYLHVLWSIFFKPLRRHYIYAALLLGVSFYVYLYSWTYLLLLNGLCLGIFIFLKEKEKIKPFIFSILAGIFFGLPMFYHLFLLYTNKYYSGLALSMSLNPSRSAVLSVAVLIVFFLLLASCLSKDRSKQHIFWLSLMFTSLLVVNQQIITGVVLQEGHYHWYFNLPVSSLVLLWVLWFYKCKWYGSFIKAIVITLVVLSVGSVVLVQNNSFFYHFDKVVSQQEYKKIFDWLNKNTKTDDVVFADQQLSEFIPVFTRNDVYWERHAAFYLIPPERVKTALYAYFRLNRIKPSCWLKNDCLKFPEIANSFFSLPTTPYFIGTMEEYDIFFSAEFISQLKHYRLDYFIFDKQHDNNWNINDLKPSFSTVYSDERFDIYQVK